GNLLPPPRVQAVRPVRGRGGQQTEYSRYLKRNGKARGLHIGAFGEQHHNQEPNEEYPRKSERVREIHRRRAAGPVARQREPPPALHYSLRPTRASMLVERIPARFAGT